MSGTVTHVDFGARRVRTDRDVAGWPVLIAKPLRRTETDDATRNDSEHLETAA